VLAAIGLARPLWQDVRMLRFPASLGAPRLQLEQLFPLALIVLLGAMLLMARDWRTAARIAPQIVGTVALACAALSLLNSLFRRAAPPSPKMHMDLAAETRHVGRAALFLGWFAAFLAAVALIGFIPAAPLFVVAYMRLENREPWQLVLAHAAVLTGFVYVVFERILHVPWPETLLGRWFPMLKFIPSV
jgi:hypothetical protein